MSITVQNNNFMEAVKNIFAHAHMELGINQKTSKVTCSWTIIELAVTASSLSFLVTGQ